MVLLRRGLGAQDSQIVRGPIFAYPWYCNPGMLPMKDELLGRFMKVVPSEQLYGECLSAAVLEKNWL
jgi:hypothetical protein